MHEAKWEENVSFGGIGKINATPLKVITLLAANKIAVGHTLTKHQHSRSSNQAIELDSQMWDLPPKHTLILWGRFLKRPLDSAADTSLFKLHWRARCFCTIPPLIVGCYKFRNQPVELILINLLSAWIIFTDCGFCHYHSSWLQNQSIIQSLPFLKVPGKFIHESFSFFRLFIVTITFFCRTINFLSFSNSFADFVD